MKITFTGLVASILFAVFLTLDDSLTYFIVGLVCTAGICTCTVTIGLTLINRLFGNKELYKWLPALKDMSAVSVKLMVVTLLFFASAYFWLMPLRHVLAECVSQLLAM